jgi:hypothetical protein
VCGSTSGFEFLQCRFDLLPVDGCFHLKPFLQKLDVRGDSVLVEICGCNTIDVAVQRRLERPRVVIVGGVDGVIVEPFDKPAIHSRRGPILLSVAIVLGDREQIREIDRLDDGGILVGVSLETLLDRAPELVGVDLSPTIRFIDRDRGETIAPVVVITTRCRLCPNRADPS